MPKVSQDKKRVTFYATKREQEFIKSVRQYAGHEDVGAVMSRAYSRELDILEKKMDYIKQQIETGKAEPEEIEEYKKLSILHGPIEVLYLNWRELLQEIIGKIQREE